MIRPFFTSLGCPEVLEKSESQGPKKEHFQKIKKHPQVFIQPTSVPNSLGFPKSLGKTHTHTKEYSEAYKTNYYDVTRDSLH